MKWSYYPTLVFLIISISFLGCRQPQYPLDVKGGNIQAVADPIPFSVAQGLVEFSDDFEAGLDPGVWLLEYVNGAQWTHMTEGGNGYIHAPTQYPNNYGNRCTDILTHTENFDNFTFTWDMRFLNKGFHKDRRIIYFRCDDYLVNPHGYVIHTAVGYPYGPEHWLDIGKTNPDGSSETIAPRIEPSWVLNQWFSFKLEAKENTFKLKIWVKGEAEPDDWTVEAVDPTSTYSSGRIGFGNYLQCNTDVDNVVVSSLIHTVNFDIKPGSCPNPLNVNLFNVDPPKNAKSMKGGVLPAAILGTSDFDVSDIDVLTIRLEGVAPIRHSYEDVATAVENHIDCECTVNGPDGNVDLTLKFKTNEIAAALGEVSVGDVIPVSITGQLLDGTEFEGVDCVWIVGKRSDLMSF